MNSSFPQLAELKQQYSFLKTKWNVAIMERDAAAKKARDLEKQIDRALFALSRHQLSIRGQCVHEFELYNAGTNHNPKWKGDGKCITCGRMGAYNAETGEWVKFYRAPDVYGTCEGDGSCGPDCEGEMCCGGGSIESDEERSDIDEAARNWTMPTPENNYNQPTDDKKKKKCRVVRIRRA